MPQQQDRRAFLRSSAASGLLLLKPETVFGSQANSRIELGMIGCGGRGVYIGNFFLERTPAAIVALAEPLPDRVDDFKRQVKAADARVYSGLNGYRELLNSKLDAVVIESPPYFHPEQARAAVEAGKHVFLAKPIAVDVFGCQTISESGRKALGKVSFMVDFQTRARPVFQELARRVHRGDIGRPIFAQVQYHNPGIIRERTRQGDTPLQHRVRNWILDKRLSGDCIVEQHIHTIDVGNWLLNATPLEAAPGACRRVDDSSFGNELNLFLARFTYPDNVECEFAGSWFEHGFRDQGARVHGTEGTAEGHYMGVTRIHGRKPWLGGETDETRLGARTNVEDFVQSISEGRYVNNAADAVATNLTCILGRTAAYRRERVTWGEMIRANERIDAELGPRD